MNATEEKRLEALIRHCDNVQGNCQLLGERLIEQGKDELGRKLIANGRIHDASKFGGIEWQYLHADMKETHPELFKQAAIQHITTNPHHPEYWVGGIEEMDALHLAEMVCDWYARSMEFGDNIWDWVKGPASDRYAFSLNGRVYKEIKGYLDLLLEKKFRG